VGDVWDTLLKFFEKGTVGNPLLDLLFRTIEALVILAIFIIGGRITKRFLKQITTRTSHNPNLGALVGNLTYVIFIIVAILSILTIYTGAGFQSLLTLLGIISLAISLAFQDILKNLIAGMYLLLEQPFKIGDTIRVKDVEGQVTSIEIRTTNIKTEGNFQIVIPNGIVFSEIVTNHTAYRSRLVAVKLILPPELSMSEASEKIKETLTNFPGEDIIQKPHFAIYLESTLEGKTHIRVEFWTSRHEHRHVGSKVALALREALPQVEISAIG